MSRDVYDQFRAAQEAFAAQEMAQKQEEQRKLMEAEGRRAAAEAEKERIKEEARMQREAKIAKAKEDMLPVNTRLLEILEAIKTHDPRINHALLRGIAVNSIPYERKGDFEQQTYAQLMWGNKFGMSDSEQRELEHPAGLGLLVSLFGIPSPDRIVAEDFNLVSVYTDPNIIRVILPGKTHQQIETADFINDDSSILSLLAKAISDPIRRFYGFAYYETRFGKNYSIRDVNNTQWDYTNVGIDGRRDFDNHYEAPDTY